MDVYGLEQSEACVPTGKDWLHNNEILCRDSLHFPKRRSDWELGRWTAKCAVASCLNLPFHPRVLARLEIRAMPSGAPQVFIAGRPASMTISLSHRDGISLCMVARIRLDLGCDIETIEPRSDGFIADYFTAQEQSLIARVPGPSRPRLVALLWSAKESALKALQTGLRQDTRSVSVSLSDDGCDVRGWSPLQVTYSAGDRRFYGWWHSASGIVRTMVASPRPGVPMMFGSPAYSLDRTKRCA